MPAVLAGSNKLGAVKPLAFTSGFRRYKTSATSVAERTSRRKRLTPDSRAPQQLLVRQIAALGQLVLEGAVLS